MDIRSIALQSLIDICKKDAYSNIVVSQTIKRYRFDDRDRRFYTELVYGTVRYLNYLDWIMWATAGFIYSARGSWNRLPWTIHLSKHC